MADDGDRARYGFDAPGIMRGLLAGGGAAAAVGTGAALLTDGWLRAAAVLVAVLALVPLVLGVSMLLYGIVGKHRVRDELIGRVAWRGDEAVLDVGTGLGLLLIAAAKRLDRGGHATGIDIWRAEDLSGGGMEQLTRNVAIEGVADRVTLLTEDARTLSFADGSMDVVLSLFCLHNIDDDADRRTALLEIVRVLKPGGRALVGEWLPVGSYAAVFRQAGLRIRSCRSHARTALAPMWIVEADKPP